MERILYKSQCKRLFNLSGGICYLKMRGSIYFLTSTKNDSMIMLRKNMNYEKKTPIEFYNIIHEDYLAWCDKTKRTNEKKQSYYAERRIQKNKDKIEKLKAEIKILESGLK